MTLPVDEIKVDRSLVAGMHGNRATAAVVQSMIGLARDLGLVVVAEGVEDAVTLAVLTDLGCDLAQGFHLARPLPADELRAWALAHPAATAAAGTGQ